VKLKCSGGGLEQECQDVEHAMQSNDMMGINPYLLQLALGKFEDELSEYFEEILEE